MVTISAYTFASTQAADEAMTELNTYFGLPVPGGITVYDANSYSYSAINNVWYIEYDPSFEPVLGQPVDLELESPMSTTPGGEEV